MTPEEFLRLTVDPLRLAILGRAAEGPVDSADLASALGVQHRRVLGAIGKLRNAGLLDDSLRLDAGVLRRLAGALPGARPASTHIVEGPWSAEEATILDRFFEGSRLTSIPMNRSKRLVVLERLAQEFEPGLRYSERLVNLTLRTYHDDYAALRRYLVDEGLLTRAEGVYWRSGGRYPAGT
jgi:hypothetical protein